MCSFRNSGLERGRQRCRYGVWRVKSRGGAQGLWGCSSCPANPLAASTVSPSLVSPSPTHPPHCSPSDLQNANGIFWLSSLKTFHGSPKDLRTKSSAPTWFARKALYNLTCNSLLTIRCYVFLCDPHPAKPQFLQHLPMPWFPLAKYYLSFSSSVSSLLFRKIFADPLNQVGPAIKQYSTT